MKLAYTLLLKKINYYTIFALCLELFFIYNYLLLNLNLVHTLHYKIELYSLQSISRYTQNLLNSRTTSRVFKFNILFIIGLSLGGVLASHIYDFYGGVWLFKLFTYGSALMCVLQIIYNLLTKSN